MNSKHYYDITKNWSNVNTRSIGCCHQSAGLFNCSYNYHHLLMMFDLSGMSYVIIHANDSTYWIPFGVWKIHDSILHFDRHISLLSTTALITSIYQEDMSFIESKQSLHNQSFDSSTRSITMGTYCIFLCLFVLHWNDNVQDSNSSQRINWYLTLIIWSYHHPKTFRYTIYSTTILSWDISFISIMHILQIQSQLF
jgi:hypothetical protein